MGAIEKWLEEHNFKPKHHKKKHRTKAERKRERELVAKHARLHREAMKR